ncbi:hypothetical protein RRG08_053779 [Elysia crispata]|uniref:Uncharacterized protein n=1 Tax=Elysia crispata TaxID=231223 RepID=A0AAE1DDA2_9GAST|nr:hypothetical protein RRG08_053779 [Elysia crispata]
MDSTKGNIARAGPLCFELPVMGKRLKSRKWAENSGLLERLVISRDREKKSRWLASWRLKPDGGTGNLVVKAEDPMPHRTDLNQNTASKTTQLRDERRKFAAFVLRTHILQNFNSQVWFCGLNYKDPALRTSQNVS